MAKQQFSTYLATLTVALTLELFTITPPIAQAQTETTPSTQDVSSPWEPGTTPSAYNPPPDINSPGRRESGGRRPVEELKCPNDPQVANPPLTALVPTVNEENFNAPLTRQGQIIKLMGLTIEAHPTFFVYVPQTSARTAEFILKDANDNDVYRTDITISNVSGIVSIKLPDKVPPLAIGYSYQWYFAIRCDPTNKRKDLVVSGWIWRTQLSPSLASELEKASIGDRAVLYRQHKIWYQALTTLASLRRSNPDNPQLAAEWKLLLQSAGLSEIAEESLVTLQSF